MPHKKVKEGAPAVLDTHRPTADENKIENTTESSLTSELKEDVVFDLTDVDSMPSHLANLEKNVSPSYNEVSISLEERKLALEERRLAMQEKKIALEEKKLEIKSLKLAMLKEKDSKNKKVTLKSSPQLNQDDSSPRKRCNAFDVLMSVRTPPSPTLASSLNETENDKTEVKEDDNENVKLISQENRKNRKIILEKLASKKNKKRQPTDTLVKLPTKKKRLVIVSDSDDEREKMDDTPCSSKSNSMQSSKSTVSKNKEIVINIEEEEEKEILNGDLQTENETHKLIKLKKAPKPAKTHDSDSDPEFLSPLNEKKCNNILNYFNTVHSDNKPPVVVNNVTSLKKESKYKSNSAAGVNSKHGLQSSVTDDISLSPIDKSKQKRTVNDNSDLKMLRKSPRKKDLISPAPELDLKTSNHTESKTPEIDQKSKRKHSSHTKSKSIGSSSKDRPALKTLERVESNRRSPRKNKAKKKNDSIDPLDCLLECRTTPRKRKTLMSTSSSFTTPEKRSSRKRSSSRTPWQMRIKAAKTPSPLKKISDGIEVCESPVANDSDEELFTPKKIRHQRKLLNQNNTIPKKVDSKNQRSNNFVKENAKRKLGKDDDDGEVQVIEPSSKCNVRLAPMFAKRKSLEKKRESPDVPDPAVLKARQKFLQSGIPECMKKVVEIIFREEVDDFLFPTIAHIRQQEDSDVWNLPEVDLKLLPITDNTDFLPALPSFVGLFDNHKKTTSDSLTIQAVRPTAINLSSCRMIVKGLKSENPDIPILRMYKALRDRNLKLKEMSKQPSVKESGSSKKTSAKRASRRKRITSESKEESETKTVVVEQSCQMWTEKYKPLSANEVVGNRNSIHRLKLWLESWKKFRNCDLPKPAGRRKKRSNSESDDDFLAYSSSDEESNENMPVNTALLFGSHGCGKTSTVYALANELDFEVLESNASSKRSGKCLLSEFQGATHSHRLYSSTKPSEAVDKFFISNKSKKKSESKTKHEHKEVPATTKKMSLVLIDDADIVFDDQDEGFVNALSTLVSTSRRPLIFIANNVITPHLAKFFQESMVIEMLPPCLNQSTTLLQLISLLEGVRASTNTIQRLLKYNCNDISKSILQLQFWTLSGGSSTSECDPIDTISTSSLVPKLRPDDVEIDNESYLSSDSEEKEVKQIREHCKCIETFVPNANSLCPFPVKLTGLWWNLAPLLCMPQVRPRKPTIIPLVVTENKLGPYEKLRSEFYSSDEESSTKVTYQNASENVPGVTSTPILLEDPSSGKVPEKSTAAQVLEEHSAKKSEENSAAKILEEHSAKVSEKSTPAKVLEEHSAKVSMENSTANVSGAKQTESTCKNTKDGLKRTCSQFEMEMTAKLMDSLSAMDVLDSNPRLNGDNYDVGPCPRVWEREAQEGVSIRESLRPSWCQDEALSQSLIHFVIEKSIKRCRSATKDQPMFSQYDLILPSQGVISWRYEQQAADNTIVDLVPINQLPDHRAIFTDYLPMLQSVCSNEAERFERNTARQNRFFHYLRGLGIHPSEGTLNILSSTFKSGLWEVGS